MRHTGFYFIQTDDDPQHSKGQQKVKESDGFVCAHCQQPVWVKPFADPADFGGFCRVCGGSNYLDGLICPQCAATGLCDPFEEKLKRVEAGQMLWTDIRPGYIGKR
jgi:hypothetical protein